MFLRFIYSIRYISKLVFIMLSRTLFATSRVLPMYTINLQAFATVSDVAACSTQFTDIVRSRTCCHNFLQKDVDDTLLNHILSETLVHYLHVVVM